MRKQKSPFFAGYLLALLYLLPSLPSSCTETPTVIINTSIPPTTTNTVSPVPTITLSLPTQTEIIAQNIVFFGDSALAVGEAGDGEDHVGFSFVSNLSNMLSSSYTLITANYGGRTAKWGFSNLDNAVIEYQPDVVTLWWGLNDLGGCPGIFDRETNEILPYMVDALVAEHIHYLGLQIDALIDRGVPVYVMTPLPVLLGNLPWSHFDENNNLIWEDNRWCNYNLGLQTLAQAQRDLVTQYRINGAKVFLVDVWQIYMDHPDADKMYMDVVHPASYGVQLIAEGWLKTFEESQR
jgi:lysophospholipase L1-like esterase